MRRVGFAALALLLGLSLTLGLFEVCLRSNVIKTRHYDRLLSQGHKDPPKRNLLILGDSFFDRRMRIGEFLRERLEPIKVETLNLALSGMGPMQYLWELQAYGESFQPDTILLSYYVGNDLTDVQYRMEDALTLKARIKNTLRPIIRRVYLYHFLRERIEHIQLRGFDYARMLELGVDPEVVELATKGELNPFLIELGMRRPNHLLDGILMETEENIQAWRRIEGALEQIHALSSELEAELAIVIFPRSIQIDDSHFELFAELGFNLDPATLKSNKPQSLLLAFCTDQGIRCLDLLPSFRARKDEALYREHDDHLSPAGNAFAAGQIAEFLR